MKIARRFLLGFGLRSLFDMLCSETLRNPNPTLQTRAFNQIFTHKEILFVYIEIMKNKIVIEAITLLALIACTPADIQGGAATGSTSAAGDASAHVSGKSLCIPKDLRNWSTRLIPTGLEISFNLVHGLGLPDPKCHITDKRAMSTSSSMILCSDTYIYNNDKQYVADSLTDAFKKQGFIVSGWQDVEVSVGVAPSNNPFYPGPGAPLYAVYVSFYDPTITVSQCQN